MIEWAFPAIVVGSALISTGMSDRKKIETIFRNVKIGIPEGKKLRTPKFHKKKPILKGSKEIGKTYFYDIPLGLPASMYAKAGENMRVFEESLKKPVELEFRDGYLQIHVYNEDIPKFVAYSSIDELPEKKWSVPLGYTPKGILWHDFDQTPHITVSGTARFGKTVLLKVIMTWLIEHHPDDVEFYIIDLKGGLEFNRYRNLKQVKMLAKDPLEAARLLEHLLDRIQQDEAEFLKHHYTNISDTPIRRRVFIITDEGAQLTPFSYLPKEQKQLLSFCQSALSEICRVAGALGYRNIFCTQYPTADCMPRQVKMNSDTKISFRLGTGYASEVAIDDRGAEELPSDIKGRALVKTHELKQVQVPYISDQEAWGRLQKYQRMVMDDWIVEQREEKAPSRENFIQFG